MSAPRILVDPRIRARRVAVRRAEGRARLHRLVLAALAAVVAVLAAVATGSPLLDVDRVAVAGAGRTGADRIRTVLGIERGDPLVLTDLGAAEARLEDLPWVATAQVERSWPSTVRVAVREREPVAVAPALGGRWVLVDAEGRQLAATDDPVGLPALDRPAAAAAPGEALARSAPALAVVTALPPPVTARVVRVAATAERAELVLRLDDAREVPVALGAPEALERKALSLATLLASVDQAGLAAIDLRVSDAPVLTRR